MGGWRRTGRRIVAIARMLLTIAPLACSDRVAPAFTAKAVTPDGEFVDVSLSDFKGKYTVVFFYPLDFTFVCPTELIAFSDRMGEFDELDVNVLGVSIDSHFSHLQWMNTPRKQGGLGGLKYPLVADLTKSISKDYGVLIEDGENAGIALRGLFIINPEGVVQHATVNNLPVGRNVEETLRVLQAFQYVQSNPDEVCPANWTPGEKTMKPDPKGSKEYFSSIG